MSILLYTPLTESMTGLDDWILAIFNEAYVDRLNIHVRISLIVNNLPTKIITQLNQNIS